MVFISDWYVLPLAFLFDLLMGDPRWLFHPVRWMGKGIETLEPVFRKKIIDPRKAGLILALTLIFSTFAASLLVLNIVNAVSPLLGTILEVLMLYFCLSSCSLRKEALGVLEALEKHGLEPAKKRLAMIVGRDVEPLDEEGVCRAALETVAENFVDGVLSPLFWAGLGGAPLAMAYKMVNTLDSMVGYKNETYIEFGWASARIDDIANYIPSRLSVLVIAVAVYLTKGDWKKTLDTGKNEGRNHASPNAGYPEAAFAGALGVKLGGPNLYGGIMMEKPYIGKDGSGVSGGHVRQACSLLQVSTLVAVFTAMTLAHIMTLIV